MYQVQNPINTAISGMGQAANTFGAMTKAGPQRPGPTAGGAVMSGVGGAVTASALGSAMGGAAGGAVGGPPGMVVGALMGIGSYLLS